MKPFLIGFAAGTIASAAIFLLSRNRSAEAPLIFTDTVTVVDTIFVNRPVERERLVVKTIVKSLPLAADTAAKASVEVPVERIVYQTDDYRAVITGFDATLDSLELFRPSTVITRTIPPKPTRWSLSITAGAAVTPRGLQPALTLGLSYSLLRF